MMRGISSGEGFFWEEIIDSIKRRLSQALLLQVQWSGQQEVRRSHPRCRQKGIRPYHQEHQGTKILIDFNFTDKTVKFILITQQKVFVDIFDQTNLEF